MCFGANSVTMNSILIGSFIIVLTGIIDDINDLRASRKLLGQLVAAIVIVFYGKIVLTDISIFGFYIEFGAFSEILTLFFIIACVNIINLTEFDSAEEE